jgi:hypothetical protein
MRKAYSPSISAYLCLRGIRCPTASRIPTSHSPSKFGTRPFLRSVHLPRAYGYSASVNVEHARTSSSDSRRRTQRRKLTFEAGVKRELGTRSMSQEVFPGLNVPGNVDKSILYSKYETVGLPTLLVESRAQKRWVGLQVCQIRHDCRPSAERELITCRTNRKLNILSN